jgi:WD40 repeat protein
MLDNWLADARRTLRKPQREAILETFRVEGSPLWLRTATEEAVRLASWKPVPSFAPTTHGLLGQVLDRLSREEEHGAVLVSRTLDYLACARHGLAEDEMLGILSADAEVMADFVRRSPNSPRAGNLPVAVWVRLHGDLAFYLAEHEAQEGSSLLGFYHRSILEAVKGRYLAAREDRRGRHRHMAEWFGHQAWFLAPVTDKAGPAEGAITDPPNARKASELPWHLYRTAMESGPEGGRDAVWQPLADTLCDILLVEAKVRSGLVFELQEDYRLALDALPEMVSEVKERQEREARIERWTAEITAYARAWSERHDRRRRTSAALVLPEPVSVCRMWTEEEIAAQCRRIGDHPSRLDRLSAFAGFVASGCQALHEFGQTEGFVLQYAVNQPPGGPVQAASAARIADLQRPLLRHRWQPEVLANPMPALLRTLTGHTGGAACVSMTPDGRRAVSGGDSILRVWDLETGESRAIEEDMKSVLTVAVTPDGRRAVSGSYDGRLRVWDLETGACLHNLTAIMGMVNSVSVTPDGRRAVSGSGDETLRIWDLESGQCLRTLAGHTHHIVGVDITADGRRAVSVSQDNTVRVWNLETGVSAPGRAGHESHCRVGLTPDGQRAVSGGRDCLLRVWDTQSGQCLQELQRMAIVENLCVTRDGQRAVSQGWDNTLRVWNLESGACLHTLEGHSQGITCMSVTPDGRVAVSGSDDATLRVWDVEAGACRHILEGHTKSVHCVSVTPNGRRAVSAGLDDKRLRVWDLKTGKFLRVLEGHTDEIYCVCATPDGRHAVSGGGYMDPTLRMWDLETGACLRVMKGHGRSIDKVCVTRDGRRAVSACRDGDFALRVWDLETGACLHALAGHSETVHCLSVTPDGRFAASGSQDKILRVWDLNSGSCVAMFPAPATIWSVAISRSAHLAVCGTLAGEVIILQLGGLEFRVPVRTAAQAVSLVRGLKPTPAAAFPPAPRPRPFWRALSRVCRAVSYPWRRQSRT